MTIKADWDMNIKLEKVKNDVFDDPRAFYCQVGEKKIKGIDDELRNKNQVKLQSLSKVDEQN